MTRKKRNQVIPPLPQEGFVRLPQVLHALGIGKTSFWLGIKQGHYPAPIKLGPRTTAWRVEDIRGLINQLSNQENNKRKSEVQV